MYTDEWRRLNGVWHHYQDWPAPARAGDDGTGTEAMLLLHGLTQQSHAFDAFAARPGRRHRCLALDFRGRGVSDWAPGTYTIPQYVLDVLALLDALSIETAHVLGTSLGGLVGLSLAAAAPHRLGSLVLNDIGPEIDPRGAARIAAYGAAVPEAFADLASAGAWALEQYPWLAGLHQEAVTEAVRWAVRRCPDGRWRLKFDPTIGRAPRPTPEAARAASHAWWTTLESLRCPVLLVRGAESDVLSTATAARMASRQHRLIRVDVPGVGHAPTLGEPVASAALEAFYVGISTTGPAPAEPDPKHRGAR
jgi:pimeloyl-ACP methyl ester carboxylesterase